MSESSWISFLPKERSELYYQVVENKMDWQTALEKLTTLPKPWNTKEWKEKRKALIKNECHNCSASNGPMVLQHIDQPPTFHHIVKALAEYDGVDLFSLRQKTLGLRDKLVSEIQPEQRNCCPKCGSVNLQFIKSRNVWKCIGKTKRRHCYHEFASPHMTDALTPESKNKIAKIKSDWWRSALGTYKDINEIYGKTALLIGFEYSGRYFSLENTKTLCKKCAFIEDKESGAISDSQARKFSIAVRRGEME